MIFFLFIIILIFFDYFNLPEIYFFNIHTKHDTIVRLKTNTDFRGSILHGDFLSSRYDNYILRVLKSSRCQMFVKIYSELPIF